VKTWFQSLLPKCNLYRYVQPGNKLLFADGSLVIEVVEILDERNLKGKVLNTKKLGERKNGNLPGVKVGGSTS
jgi:pyruvate kinase